MRAITTAIAAATALMLGACPSDDEPGYEEEDAGHVPDGNVMACPDGTPETVLGMIVEGAAGTLRTKLVEAGDLPAKKGLNTWTVEITDAEDEPLDDVTMDLSNVDGVMPAHTHDLNHDVVVEDLGNGRFEVREINFHMDGYWELTFSPTSESLGSDDMTFPLCTEASISAAEHGGAEH